MVHFVNNWDRCCPDANTSGGETNLLLSTLSETDWAIVSPRFEPVHLQDDQMLHESGCPITVAYFPTTAILSLTQPLNDGASPEVASVGREGMVGLPIVTGGGMMTTRVRVLASGIAYRVRSQDLQFGVERCEVLLQVLLRYLEALLRHISQVAFCNRHHALHAQVCCWVLLNFDRVQSNRLLLTQQKVADAIGVRRERITTALSQLHHDQVIRRSRGCIDLIDRLGLQEQACECYRVLREGWQLEAQHR